MVKRRSMDGHAPRPRGKHGGGGGGGGTDMAAPLAALAGGGGNAAASPAAWVYDYDAMGHCR